MAASDLEFKITNFAFQSRYVILMIQILSNAIIPDHDAEAFNPPRPKNEETFILDKFISVTLGGFIRWDGVYFLHIAEYGYTYDNCLAFFPLFPFLVRFISCTILFPLQYIMTYRSVVILSAYILNQYIFIKSAVLVYALGKKVLGNEVISYKAALLFCINPASIFMSAPYSETLFSFLTFSSMLQFEQNQFWSACSIGLSFLTRSNGIITAGFKLHFKMKELFQKLLAMKKVITKFSTMCLGIWFLFWMQVFPFIIYFVICISPFVVYELLAYQIHCKDELGDSIPAHLSVYGQQKGYKIRDEKIAPWCNYSIPIPYGYVQTEIWNVGLFRYYQFRQIPNFLLAFPVTFLSLSAICHYIFLNRHNFFSLVLLPDDTHYKKSDSQGSMTMKDVLQSRRLLPYIFHLMFFVIFSWLLIHIQVMTRMVFSSSPVLYWYSAYIMTTKESYEQPSEEYNKWDVAGYQTEKHQVETKYNLQHNIRNILTDQIFNFKCQTLQSKLILSYFIGYSVIGTVLFSNFLPWT